MSKVIKAVIPTAGMGTRFLPATKALPKEMLPIVDKPVIQYVVEEAVSAGLVDILFVTGRNKNALENHFDRFGELETHLKNRGDQELLNNVMNVANLADIHYTRQGNPRGLGHAVLRGQRHVGRDSFVVLLADDVMQPGNDLLKRMIDLHNSKNATVIALMEVDPSETHLYGCAKVETTSDADVVKVVDLVEKPADGTAPSNLAVIGRYVLKPEIFDVLEKTEAGSGGEIQLTDALRELAVDETIAGPVFGIIYRGPRHDTGDKLGYLKAIVDFGSQREDIGPEFKSWLKSFTK